MASNAGRVRANALLSLLELLQRKLTSIMVKKRQAFEKFKYAHCTGVRIFTECNFFCSLSFFVNKVVLSQACLHELCWIEHERMLLAHHGNVSAPLRSHRRSLVSRASLVSPNKRRLNPYTMSSNVSRFYLFSLSNFLSKKRRLVFNTKRSLYS